MSAKESAEMSAEESAEIWIDVMWVLSEIELSEIENEKSVEIGGETSFSW